MKNHCGYFVISLDFELMWGVLDVPYRERYKKNIRGGREAVPNILRLFEKYHVHATWATVGMLFLENKRQIDEFSPTVKPSFKNGKVSSYNYIKIIGTPGEEDELYFAKPLIELIQKTEGQELASHTYSHYYCNEEGADSYSFYHDIMAAIRVAKEKFNVKIESLIFPRNQAKDEYVKAAEKAGIKFWRGNARGYSVVRSPFKRRVNRICRLIDTYFPLYGHLCYDKDHSADGILCMKSSRFLRPYSNKLKWLEWLKLRRIKKQMEYAATNGKVFHLWWHPHNFGGNPEIMLNQLESILKFYSELHDKYNFTSCSMKELA